MYVYVHPRDPQLFQITSMTLLYKLRLPCRVNFLDEVWEIRILLSKFFLSNNWKQLIIMEPKGYCTWVLSFGLTTWSSWLWVYSVRGLLLMDITWLDKVHGSTFNNDTHVSLFCYYCIQSTIVYLYYGELTLLKWRLYYSDVRLPKANYCNILHLPT